MNEFALAELKAKVLAEVDTERINQNFKWGIQNHCPKVWLMILGEEVGEANKAILESSKYKDGKLVMNKDLQDFSEYRKELIQIAAVAVAMVECLDRKEW